MENRKPAGRPAKRYDRPSGEKPGTRRPAEKHATRDQKPLTKQEEAYARLGKPATKDDKKSSRQEKSSAVRGRTVTGKEKTITGKGKSSSKEKNSIVTRIRLNRFIANSGVCSRRDADEHIQNGLITINGTVVTDLGTKVTYDDDVRFKNKKLSAEKKVYILMNKPKDYVTTVEDPHAEHTVLDLIGDECPERVYPVGRLDRATTGVLLLTNDGDLAGKLTHPKYKRKKIYHVWLDKDVIKNDLFKITEGIDLDGTTVVADAISYADADDRSQIGIELHSGQNRVIRRMFETLGYKVKKLDRVYFAGLTKKNVARGKWRFLTDKEISMLKRGIF
jgi:23S rRNA pseudouridine2605 synthase